MDFEPTEEQRLALDGWERFVRRDIAPVTERYRDELIPKEAAHQLLKQSIPYGVGAGWVPEEAGGVGLDFLTSGLLYEVLARVSPDFAGLAFVTEGAAIKLHRTGSPALKERYLGRLLAGELIGCSAISEPDVGSGVREMRTRAEPVANGWKITGEKMWISNASIADVVVVLARTGEHQFTNFLVDRAEHGFRSAEISKLGLNGWSLGQIFFDGVVVPEENIMGGLGGGLRETMHGFERSRCFLSMLALGISHAALAAAIDYAGQRHQLGKLIAGHQLIQSLLAEMAMNLDAARLLVYRALSMMSKGQRCEKEAAMAKIFATEGAVRITSQAIQVHGACGISREFPLERYYRGARLLTIPDGTTQINQLILGRALTGVAAF
ncbi:MAG: acyl-CoA/acyl-ACP dehydrogenase [Burkholderiales bacterium]|nr:MAG: acyl-CoA/acyl-ACP dehydrogenase [Burkholderiales bacterium]